MTNPSLIDSSELKPPLFFCDDGDLIYFLSWDNAASYIEPIDIENGVYTCFDSTGLFFDLALGDDNSIVAYLNGDSSSEQLSYIRKMLERSLQSIGVEFDSEISLDKLLAFYVDHMRPVYQP